MLKYLKIKIIFKLFALIEETIFILLVANGVHKTIHNLIWYNYTYSNTNKSFKYSYAFTNTNNNNYSYTCAKEYNFNFSKMVIDMGLKITM